MGDSTQRLRLVAAMPLWPILTRAAIKDGAQTTWGATAALLCASFFFYVARSQVAWLGRPEREWWHTNCKAEIAAYAAMISPQSYFIPVAVFAGVFKLLFTAEALSASAEGGALWKCAPLVLLLYPRWGYALDVLGVACLLAARHYKTEGSVCSQPQFHREHERRAAVDLLGVLVLSSAGAPTPTRLCLLANTTLLCLLVHAKYPRKDVSYFDAVNNVNTPVYMNIPFRKVNIK